MALSIKTDEADRLARRLAKVTGETMTEAVTVALRERLEREEQIALRTPEQKLADLDVILARMRVGLDTRPVTKDEWDEASGDTD
jgi:antitoxin VapB